MNPPQTENPELRELVELARAQRAPAVSTSFDDVVAASSQGAFGRPWVIAGVALAAAALAWVVVPSFTSPSTGGETVAAEVTTTRSPAAPDEVLAVPSTAAAAPEVEPIPEPPAKKPARAKPEQVALAAGIFIEPLQDAAPPLVLGVSQVQVAGGSYRIETEASAVPLEIVVGPRIARIEPGSKVTLSTDGKLDVEAGAASWIDPPAKGRGSTAAELSQAAERAMATNNGRAAIRALTKLVRKHPRSAAARAGLIDLARLHRSAGASDRARCAYKLYLQRWPSASLRPEVERALRNLGEGRACRGLAPR